jgi:hypothetical protein
MNNKKLIVSGLIHSLGVLVYVGAVAWLMFNGSKIFGQQDDNFLMPVAMLLLLITSATITGSLVLGKPVILFLGGQKSEAIKLLGYTIGWIVVFMLVILIGMVILK